MQIKRKIMIGGLTAIMATTITAGSVYASTGDVNRTVPINKSELLAKHQALEQAFANNDYEAWKALMKDRDGRVVKVINEQNFAKFAEAHRLIEQKDFKDGKKILKDLGVLGRFSLKHQAKVQKKAVEKLVHLRQHKVVKSPTNS